MARRTQSVAARVQGNRQGRDQRRSGFTLVELLVVISIIGMLAALLLPAVNQAREAGRKTVCLSNQKQIGLALTQYEQRQNAYPGYANPQATYDQTTATGGTTVQATRPVGWLFSILPFLERNDLVNQYGSPAYQLSIEKPTSNEGKAVTPFAAPNAPMKIAVCPSDARSENKNPGGTNELLSNASYVVNCGMKDSATFPFGSGFTGPRDLPQNGVFHWNFPYTAGGFSVPSEWGEYTVTTAATLPSSNKEQITKITSSFISSGDGSSTTLMLSENVDCGSWGSMWEEHVGFIWQPGLNSGIPAPGPCSLGTDNMGSVSLLKINQNVGEVDQGTIDKHAFGRPSSYHPGGVNATFCDGHTQFLADTIDYIVYCALMTPKGKATATNGPGAVVPLISATDGTQLYATTPLKENQY